MPLSNEALLELVPRINAAIALVSCPFALYEALSKKAAVADLKDKLDLRADQLIATIVSTLEEALLPHWPRSITTLIIEPSLSFAITPGLSEAARDALTKCITAKIEFYFKRLTSVRRLAGKVLLFDRALYWLIFATAVVSCLTLLFWVFGTASTPSLVKCEILTPSGFLACSLLIAGVRQSYIQACERQMIQDETFVGS